MNDLRPTPSLACHDGKASRFQSPRMAPSEETGIRPIGLMARYGQCFDPKHEGRWPGYSNGIRGPMIDETPLSYSEVAWALKNRTEAVL
jgi:hypothetical protein